jgi:hypothetical protein
MITGVTKQSPFGIDATHHKIMNYEYNKASGKVICLVKSYPSQAVAATNCTQLILTTVSIKLADLPLNVKTYLNDARDLLEGVLVTLPDFQGGVVS